ncbi:MULTISPECIES: LexA family protein [Vibrio]|uniref:SOS-response transcriptional repressors (RecA-mediated autopeptidases) n=1 Tax=Vibrio fluvialis PG41 TaxID=1336752 RepID=S7JLL4_VIBFL|nr:MULTISPECIES: LexA family transcriptional regulator [Vibrio]EKO3451703.1 LexA family transcriptional regulator [Vibrio fluvialis]EKO3461635.1 LexA family transcriptional regulator [Vibrio fluvialis]EKO3992780.1 LexA family transcriptional regulator [Vibrio fluvialis]EPP25011.1 SOS-response transcriptional repressors (RecA-mediated autopeptidases) [Vibrio fluvialis PG41]MBY7786053.1 LexA family transcriptional regulator [Vibrio fluvialis]
MDMNKKQEVGLRLKQFREAQGISQKALAEKCGWGASRIGNYESGARSINLDDAEIIASVLKIKPYQILFDAAEIESLPNLAHIDIQPKFQTSFPLLSSVQAGQWTEACEAYSLDEIDEWYEATVKTSKRSFWLRVQGDSMTSLNGVSVPEGTLVLVDTEKEHCNGSLVVAKLTDVNEATFKKFVTDGGQDYLKPLNENYKMIPINGNCKIIGVVVEARLRLI